MSEVIKQELRELAAKAIVAGVKAWREGRRVAWADRRISKLERQQIRARVREAMLGVLLEAAGLSETWLGEQIEGALERLSRE